MIVSALGVSVGVDFFVFLVLAVAGYILPDIWLDRKVEAGRNPSRRPVNSN